MFDFLFKIRNNNDDDYSEYEPIKIPTAEEAKEKAYIVKSLKQARLHEKIDRSLKLLRKNIVLTIENTIPTDDGCYTIVIKKDQIYYKRKEEIFSILEKELREKGYTMHQREEYSDWFNEEIYITIQWIQRNKKE